MSLSRRTVYPFVVLVVCAALAWTLLPSRGQADAPRTGCAGDPQKEDLASGEGTVAVSNEAIVVIGSKRDGCMYQRTAARGSLLRHVSVSPGQGTAYIEDRATGDSVVAITPVGTTRFEAEGEATHPAWSPDGRLAWVEDFKTMKLAVPGETRVAELEAPRSATGIFSPVFVGRRVVAVAQEPVTENVLTEDDVLNNLYSSDASGNWKRLTDFAVTGERWSAIRTPVITPAGDLLFVRIHGDYTQTRPPKFELWMVSGDDARMIRRLPTEMYLAGFRQGRLMWNVYSQTCGDWEILAEDPNRGLRHVGCGAVMVDPVNLVDADLEVQEHAAPAEASSTSSSGSDASLAVVIGDFTSRDRAADVAELVRGSRVLSHRAAPAAVRPGAFVVAVEIEGDPTAALSEVRRTVPALKDRTFLAPVAKLGK
jgi:hypothetical protein